LNEIKRVRGFCFHFSRQVQRQRWDDYSADLQQRLHADFLRILHILALHNLKRLILAIRSQAYDPNGRIHWGYSESLIDHFLGDSVDPCHLIALWNTLSREQRRQLHVDMVQILLAFDDQPTVLLDAIKSVCIPAQDQKLSSSYWIFQTVVEHILVDNPSLMTPLHATSPEINGKDDPPREVEACNGLMPFEMF
jgi:hypothetical protein